MSLVRELTKKNEETINGNIINVLKNLENKEKILGEITVVISACTSKHLTEISDQQILAFAKDLEIEKLAISKIAKLTAEKYEVSKRRVYQLIIENKR